MILETNCLRLLRTNILFANIKKIETPKAQKKPLLSTKTREVSCLRYSLRKQLSCDIINIYGGCICKKTLGALLFSL